MSRPSAIEQLMLEYMNRFRADPEGEYDRLIGVQDNIDNAAAFFGVDLSALEDLLDGYWIAPPLAWDDSLSAAADNHTQLMIAFDRQSHQLPYEPDLGTRITAAGYTDWLDVAENVYAFADDALFAHAGFVIDWGYDAGDRNSDGTLKADWKTLGDGIQDPPGHRDAIMNASYSDVGIGIIRETNAATAVGEYLVTQNFGLSWNSTAQFVGVVIDDTDGDEFYDIGEGLGGVTVTLRQGDTTLTTTTWDAGGYQIAAGYGEWEITFSGGDLNADVVKTANMSAMNVKVDAINPEAASAPPIVSIDRQDVLRSGEAAFGKLQDAITVTDPNGDTITQYQLRDEENEFSWRINGTIPDSGTVQTVTSLDNVYFRAEQNWTDQTLSVRASDGTEWGAWTDFIVSTPFDHEPIVKIENITLPSIGNAWRNLLDYAEINEQYLDGVIWYEIEEALGADRETNQYFNWRVDGEIVDATDGYVVTDLNLVEFQRQAPGRTELLFVRAKTNEGYTEWDKFVIMSRPTNAAPKIEFSSETVSLAAGASATLASLTQSSDGDGDKIIRYQIWDSQGGDNFTVDGTAVDASWGYAVRDLSSVVLHADDAASEQRVWVRAHDGAEWGVWDSATVITKGPNTAPVLTVQDTGVRHPEYGHQIKLADVMQVFDADGDSITKWQLWDDNGRNSWQADDTRVDASEGYITSDLESIWFSSDDIEETETLYVRAHDGQDWSAWADFEVTLVGNTAPRAEIDDQTLNAASDDRINLGDIVRATDADSDSITRYAIRDTTTDRLNFQLVDPDSAGVYFHLSGTWYFDNASDVHLIPDATASVQTLSVSVSDGNDWSDWADFTLTTEAFNHTPTVQVDDVSIMSRGAVTSVALSDFTNVTDRNNDAVTGYQIWDDVGTQNWRVDGVSVDAIRGHQLSASADISLVGDAEVGTQTLWLRASDDTGWGVWEEFTLSTVAGNAAAVVSVEDITVNRDETSWVKLSDYLTVSDAEGDTITRYEVRDTAVSNDGQGGIHNFWLGGGITDASEGGVSTDLSSIWLRPDSENSVQTLQVRADDGHGWGEWDSFELTTTTGVGAPTATVETQTIEQGAWRLLNTVLEASDPEGDTLTLYEVWDDEGSDSWWADGAVQDASAGFRTSDLSDIWFQGDSTAGSQELWVRAYDGEHWSTWDAFDLITV